MIIICYNLVFNVSLALVLSLDICLFSLGYSSEYILKSHYESQVPAHTQKHTQTHPTSLRILSDSH